MILDRLLCASIVFLAIATILSAVFLTFTGISPILGFLTVAAAALLWLVRKTIAATLKANHS